MRSRRTAWYRHRAKRIDLVFESASSICSMEKEQKARLRFAFSPAGGSFVSLMHRFRIPMGIPFEGSEVRNRRNFSWLPSRA